MILIGLMILNSIASAQASVRPSKLACIIQGNFLPNGDNNLNKTAYAVLKLNDQGLYDNAVMIDVETKKEIPGLTLSNLVLMDKNHNEIGLMLIIKNVHNDKDNIESSQVDRYAVGHTFKNKNSKMKISVNGLNLTMICTSDQAELTDY